ncbi:MAG: hypothetical protein U5K72_01880 [Balneolaceae bacterium]|nr:hypothetical protein [Balneolaceae bacterium]
MLYGCPSDSGSGGENLFEVGFETFVPVNENSDGTYNISNGGFRAYFNPQSGASSYELTVIRDDGSRGNTVNRTPDQLAKEDGQLKYQVVIGSPTYYISVNEARKDEAVEFFMNQLEDVRENYAKLEVKVVE